MHRSAWTMTVLLMLAAAGGVLAAKAAEAPFTFGVVDTDKVDVDAPRFKQYREQLGDLKQSLGAKLEIRTQNLMLGEPEISELIDLSTKTNPTAADKARIKAIQNTERSLDSELKSLQESKSLDEQKRTRMKLLAGTLQKSKTALEALNKDYIAQYQSKFQDVLAQEEKDIREACVAVAANKGYAFVFDKRATLAGGTDVTSDVIARLDRKM